MMSGNMNLNKAKKRKKEILNKLNGKQTSELIKKFHNKFLKTLKDSDYEILYENIDFFMNKDAKSAFYCMQGCYNSAIEELTNLKIEHDENRTVDTLKSSITEHDKFKSKMDNIKKIISISEETWNSKYEDNHIVDVDLFNKDKMVKNLEEIVRERKKRENG